MVTWCSSVDCDALAAPDVPLHLTITLIAAYVAPAGYAAERPAQQRRPRAFNHPRHLLRAPMLNTPHVSISAAPDTACAVPSRAYLPTPPSTLFTPTPASYLLRTCRAAASLYLVAALLLLPALSPPLSRLFIILWSGFDETFSEDWW